MFPCVQDSCPGWSLRVQHVHRTQSGRLVGPMAAAGPTPHQVVSLSFNRWVQSTRRCDSCTSTARR